MAEAAEKVRIAPRAVGEYLAQIAMVFAVQFAAGKLGSALPIISGGVGPVWLAADVGSGEKISVADGGFVRAEWRHVRRRRGAVEGVARVHGGQLGDLHGVFCDLRSGWG